MFVSLPSCLLIHIIERAPAQKGAYLQPCRGGRLYETPVLLVNSGQVEEDHEDPLTSFMTTPER